MRTALALNPELNFFFLSTYIELEAATYVQFGIDLQLNEEDIKHHKTTKIWLIAVKTC